MTSDWNNNDTTNIDENQELLAGKIIARMPDLGQCRTVVSALDSTSSSTNTTLDTTLFPQVSRFKILFSLIGLVNFLRLFFYKKSDGVSSDKEGADGQSNDTLTDAFFDRKKIYALVAFIGVALTSVSAPFLKPGTNTIIEINTTAPDGTVMESEIAIRGDHIVADLLKPVASTATSVTAATTVASTASTTAPQTAPKIAESPHPKEQSTPIASVKSAEESKTPSVVATPNSENSPWTRATADNYAPWEVATRSTPEAVKDDSTNNDSGKDEIKVIATPTTGVTDQSPMVSAVPQNEPISYFDDFHRGTKVEAEPGTSVGFAVTQKQLTGTRLASNPTTYSGAVNGHLPTSQYAPPHYQHPVNQTYYGHGSSVPQAPVGPATAPQQTYPYIAPSGMAPPNNMRPAGSPPQVYYPMNDVREIYAENQSTNPRIIPGVGYVSPSPVSGIVQQSYQVDPNAGYYYGSGYAPQTPPAAQNYNGTYPAYSNQYPSQPHYGYQQPAAPNYTYSQPSSPYINNYDNANGMRVATNAPPAYQQPTKPKQSWNPFAKKTTSNSQTQVPSQNQQSGLQYQPQGVYRTR